MSCYSEILLRILFNNYFTYNLFSTYIQIFIDKSKFLNCIIIRQYITHIFRLFIN